MMHDDCNDAWEHAVLPGQGPENNGARVSLVFKRAIVSRDDVVPELLFFSLYGVVFERPSN